MKPLLWAHPDEGTYGRVFLTGGVMGVVVKRRGSQIVHPLP